MNDIEVKQRILIKAEEIFSKVGYTKTTMEEIAANLGISKKTLYKHFANKEHVVRELVRTTKCDIEIFVENLLNNNQIEFIDKLKQFMDFIAKQSSKLNNPMVQDLFKNHPDLWNDIQIFRKQKAYNNLSRLIEEGVKRGVFDGTINTEVIVMVYISAVHNVLNPETVAELPLSGEQVYSEIIKIIFEGIFTNEGKNKYHQSIINKEKIGDINL